MILWEQDYELIDGDHGDCDASYQLIWLPVAILKITPNRVYTEPYMTPQLWGDYEARPFFSRKTLEEEGVADWHSKVPGGSHLYKRVYVSPNQSEV